MKRKFLIVLASVAVMLVPLAAQANLIFDLTVTNTPDLGGPPYVNVEVEWLDSGHAIVTADAYSPYLMGDGAGFALNVYGYFTPEVVGIYDANGDPLTVTPTFGDGNVDGFGRFNLTVNTDNFGPTNRFDRVVLDLVAPEGTWVNVAAVLAPNEEYGYTAAAHINNINVINPETGSPLTGFASVPIPPSALLLGSGLLGLLLLGRRKKQTLKS